MDLFNNYENTNLLPYDGEVYYFPAALNSTAAKSYFNSFLNYIHWNHDEVIMFGKKIVTKRKTAWYADYGLSYTYSKTTKIAKPFTNELLAVKKIAETLSESTFNACLLNLYHNGDEGMSWHSDDEKELGKNPVIASISLGAERRFLLKHRETKEAISVVLETGSLLIMKGKTQHYWLHSLPKSKKVNDARINLTFRQMCEMAE